MFSPKNGVNGVYMYAVFGGAVLLVSLPLGVFFGCFCFRIFSFRKNRVDNIVSQTLPVYEEVKVPESTVIDNEAYAILQ